MPPTLRACRSGAHDPNRTLASRYCCGARPDLLYCAHDHWAWGQRMNRREFITLVGGAAAWPLAARAQQPTMPVIGFLSGSGSPADRARFLTAFRQGVRETGYVEGQNVAIEYRWAQDQADQLPDLAADLVRRQVTVIAAHDTPSSIVAKVATTTIPIVFASGGDPIKLGLVASLNRPGGNVTGVTFINAELGAKQLGLLHELQPGAARVGVLVDPNFAPTQPFVSDVQAAALSIGKQIEVLEAPTGRDIDTAFARLAQKPIDALVVGPGPFLHNRRAQLLTLATYHRVPAIYPWREGVEAGGLMSYGTNIADAYRQAGVYTGRILKGEKPADLPVVQSTKFEFVINLNTARTFGLSFSPGLLAIADEVIE
jgi:putative tryptophan/tyrosine transport system substrate-binding protein